MAYDALLMFSNAQALTTTAVSTDVLDLGVPSVNPRSPTGAAFPAHHSDHGEPPVVIKVGATFAGLTGLTIALQGSNDNSAFVNLDTIAPAVADLKAGAEFGLNTPRGHGYRYLRLNYTVTGTATAGNITAGMADGFQTAGTF